MELNLPYGLAALIVAASATTLLVYLGSHPRRRDYLQLRRDIAELGNRLTADLLSLRARNQTRDATLIQEVNVTLNLLTELTGNVLEPADGQPRCRCGCDHCGR